MNLGKIQVRVILAGVFSLALGLSIVGCETKEENNVAQAQQCLDRLKDTAPYTSAQNCLSYISGVYTPQSYVIRCSVDFFAAGITPTSLIQTYENLKSQPSNIQVAFLMAGLIENIPGTSTTDLPTANTTFSDCVKSNSSSLIYLSGLSVIGTAMAAGAASTTPATFVAFCANPANYAACSVTTVGSTVITINQDFCSGSNAGSQVCTLINNAVGTGGTDPTAVGTALFSGI